MTTFGDIVVRVERRLSQLAGVGAQTYAEDVIYEHITTAFNSLFEEYDWPEYLASHTTTLDGTLGVSVDNMSTLTQPLRKFSDIKAIYLDKSSTPMRTAPP